MNKFLLTIVLFLMFNDVFCLDLVNVRMNYEKAVRDEKFAEVCWMNWNTILTV